MKATIFCMMFMASAAIAKNRPVVTSLLAESDQDFEKEAKNRPVSKVISLLKEMVDQLEKEGEEDEEVYETMGCWCVTNDKAKTKSIADAETKIEMLTQSIETLTAESAKLNTEIENLEAEIKKHEEALATATSVREKESAEFTEFEKSSLVYISQLKAGLQALSKLHEAALLKQKTKVSTVDAEKVKADDSLGAFSKQFKHMDHFKDIEEEALNPHLHDIKGIPKQYVHDVENACAQVSHDSLDPIHEAIDGETTGFLQDAKKGSKRPIRPAQHKYKMPKAPTLPTHIQSLLCKALRGNADVGLLESTAQVGTTAATDDSETSSNRYEPASGAIFGVLKQMQEDFENNLAQAQKAEAIAGDEYDQLKAAKETEIKTSTDQVNTKTDQLAMTDEKNAQDKEMKEDTESVLAADQAFLADLKERCASMDEEYAERTKARQLEIEAVSKALAFLNSDEAHDLFTRTFNPSFLQVSIKDKQRQAVAKMLRKTALKTQDMRMMRLATELTKAAEAKRGDNAAFDKVKEEVDEMVDKLTKENWDEIKKKDYCIGAFNTNERDLAMKERDKNDFIALIDDLKVTIDTLEKEIEVLKAEIADLEVQIKRASQNREKENAEFQTTVADQRATQKLLAVSLKILADFYKHSFLQTAKNGEKSVAGQAPPPGFKSFEKNAASGGVMGMMQSIIDDAKLMEAECIRAEEKAQKDYEDFTKDTKNAIKLKTESVETKSEDKGKAEQDLVQAKTDLDATLTEIETLINEEADLHKECDFLLKNFELTQAARTEEIESLKQANQIFSGASFQLFLQGHDDKQ